MVMLMAGLQTVPEQLLRAARVDGANAWQRFWHVTFPHLKGVSMVTVLLLMVANFNSFIIPWIMTERRPGRRLGDLDHRHLQHRLRPAALRHRLGLRGDPLHRDDGARLLLREGADPRRRGRRSMAEHRRHAKSVDWWRWAGRFVIAFLLALHRPADGLDGADLAQVAVRGDAVPAAVVAGGADAQQLLAAGQPGRRDRAGVPALLLEQLLRLGDHHDPRRRDRGAGRLRLLALPLPRAAPSSSSPCWCATCSRRWSS